jgi:hypothetical protein
LLFIFVLPEKYADDREMLPDYGQAHIRVKETAEQRVHVVPVESSWHAAMIGPTATRHKLADQAVPS